MVTTKNETMGVSHYAEDIKLTLDQGKIMVDDMVEKEGDDGRIDAGEALELFFKHGAAILAIWGHRIPFLKWMFRR